MIKKKKIAILLPNLNGGGAENMRVNLAIYWLRLNYSVEFVLLDKKGILIEKLPSTINVVDLKVKRYRTLLIPLIKYLKSTDADILLVAMWPLTVFAILANIFVRNKVLKVVVSEHSILSNSYEGKGVLHRAILNYSMKWLFPRADARIGVSHGVVKDIVKNTKLSIDTFNIIYNPAACNVLPKPKYLNISNKYKIVTAGSFKLVKNHKLLISSLKVLKCKYDLDVILYILGSGSLFNDYKEYIKKLDLSDSVIFPGFINDPKEYFLSCDLFVLSSNHEGFGNVIVEAMQCGVPIISTDCESGPREILENGKYGKLVPVGDANALAEAMNESLSKQHDTETIKLRAQDFSVEKIAKQYLDVMFPK